VGAAGPADATAERRPHRARVARRRFFPKVRGGASDAASDNMRMRSRTVSGSILAVAVNPQKPPAVSGFPSHTGPGCCSSAVSRSVPKGASCAAAKVRTHSMTSSARASTAGGMVIPRALAVFMLMKSSKCVGPRRLSRRGERGVSLDSERVRDPQQSDIVCDLTHWNALSSFSFSQ
jgi:hypothetical protein